MNIESRLVPSQRVDLHLQELGLQYALARPGVGRLEPGYRVKLGDQKINTKIHEEIKQHSRAENQHIIAISASSTYAPISCKIERFTPY
jgi:hypothetical protein